MILQPTEVEVQAWLLHVVQHVSHIEHFLQELQIGHDDPQRPHDIVGNGNKFEWEVIRGFAVQHRDRSAVFFDEHVRPALQRHRCQLHHRMWNEANEHATAEHMKLGAVDAICSLLEPRQYQGGQHTYEEILGISNNNPEHKRSWMRDLVEEMRKLPPPPIQSIVSLEDIPNIGIPREMHDILRQRVEETRRFLREEQGYHL